MLGLGILCAYIPAIASLVWAVVLIATVYGAAKNEMKWLWYGVAVSPGVELLSRMARAPYIPHEFGKYYLLFVAFLLLVHHTKRASNPAVYQVGWIMVLLLVPSLVVSLATFDYENWVLNVLGILELGILLLFTAKERWTTDVVCRMLQFALAPVLAILSYLVIKTPKFDKINFSLSSNFKTSGDFGSNQVSTILGLGIVLTAVLMVVNKAFFKRPFFNYILLAALLFRGFLTFSRGGIIVAVIAVIILILPFAMSSLGRFIKFSFMLIVVGILGAYVFNKVNEATGNQLMLRYMGETAGTMAGTKERSLNTLTSYRLEIARTDFEMFRDHWFWGVGIGNSKDLRPKYGFNAIMPHTEYTRLMSEQGIGGLLIGIVIIVFAFWWVRKQKKYYWRAVCASLFTVALLTCMHSAMRTNTTVVCFLLASIPVMYKKNNIESL